MQKLKKLILTHLKRFLDDTITYIKPDFIMSTINILNKLYENVKFSYEVEHNVKI